MSRDTSGKFDPGKTFKSNNCGKFKIVQEVERAPDGHRQFEVEFLDTGFKTVAREGAILRGRVKDKFVPSVCGVGYIGDLPLKIGDECVSFLYRPWADMLSRCYNPNDKGYRDYGAKGVFVQERWFNFTNFFWDAQELWGFERKLRHPDIYQLDEDYKQFGLPAYYKWYGPDTCIWISQQDNTMLMSFENTGSPYFGICFIEDGWVTRIRGKTYGKFTTPEAAANMFNYMYPIVKGRFNDLPIQNTVPRIPFEELRKYAINSDRTVYFNDYRAESR